MENNSVTFQCETHKIIRKDRGRKARHGHADQTVIEFGGGGRKQGESVEGVGEAMKAMSGGWNKENGSCARERRLRPVVLKVASRGSTIKEARRGD